MRSSPQRGGAESLTPLARGCSSFLFPPLRPGTLGAGTSQARRRALEDPRAPHPRSQPAGGLWRSRAPRPCSARASAPPRRPTRRPGGPGPAAGSGARRPARGAPCRPPRAATAARTTPRPTGRGRGPTLPAPASAAPRPAAPRRAARTAPAPATLLPTVAAAAAPRSSTSSPRGATSGTTRDHPGHLLHLIQRMAERKECLMMWKTITDLQCLRTHGLA